MRRSISLVALLAILTGCGAGWHRTDPAPDQVLNPRTQFILYHRAGTSRWHSLRVAADSVSGISWLSPLNCDSCRITLPNASVDSVQEGHPSAGLWKGVGLVTGAMLIVCAVGCPSD